MPQVTRYIRVHFRLVTPLSIGSGQNANSDHDVILDSSNTPVIPGTAFAGVMRHAFGETGKSTLFGYISGRNGSAESRIRFYDALPCDDENGNWPISVRDMVSLERKVGKDTSKFDMEVVEPYRPRNGEDALFAVLFELVNTTEEETTQFLQTLSGFDAGILRLGAKTSRGYGQIGLVSVEMAKFELPEAIADYLKFQPFDMKSSECYKAVDMDRYRYTSRFTHIHLDLELRGAISIRTYTAKSDNVGKADFEQLTLADNTPVIPGSTWAGAFRDRFLELARAIPAGAIRDENAGIQNAEDWVKQVFGFVYVRNRNSNGSIPPPDKRQKQSGVYFSESRITGGSQKLVTRNATNRFTGAAQNKALYSENMHYWGSCSLDIMLGHDVPHYEKALKVMRAVISDLNKGYLAVGGLTAVGHGLFRVSNEEITNVPGEGSEQDAAV